jgi:minor extracellular serine protease Vpr
MIKRFQIVSLMTLATASLTLAAPPAKPANVSKAARAANAAHKGPGHTILSAFVPNSYIVELNGEAVVPAVNRVAGTKAFATHDRKLVAQHRARVAGEQQLMRSQIEAKGAKVTGSVDVVMNAMFVHYKGTREELAALPGVKQVYGVRKMKRNLDRAVVNYQVTDVWARLGGQANAGAGMKIGILDEGIDMTSKAFSDAGFQAPAGYPIADSADDMALLNNKVIVGRSYATMVCSDPSVATCVGTTDPDPTIDDHSGHGTATASVAAGVSSSCDEPTAELNGGSCLFTNPIAGAAPGAYLGVYRIWDTINDTTTDPVIIQAINDAVADGMDVISMSFGSVYASRFDQDPEYIPVLNAYQAGVLVICSAGNSGPEFTSISSPATYPMAIAAGAASNDRSFGPAMWGPYIDTNYTLNTADGSTPASPVSGPVVDAGALNNTLGCNAFPDGSLNGAVVFISRGTCMFSVKLNNAQAAGAAAAIVYDTEASTDDCLNQGYPSGLYCAPIMQVAPATLPAQSVDFYTAAFILGQASATPFNLVVGFSDTFPVVKNLVTSFSSAGPNVDLGIKPDVVAIGENVAMATQQVFYSGDIYGSSGDLYDPSGYTVADGTSFAAPFTAGVAAMIKGARPGLSMDQYRSLIINSAKGMLDPNGNLYSNQQIGGGLLNALSAYNSPLTALPTSLGLGTQSSNPNVTQSITLTNIGATDDTFNLSVASSDGILQPVLSSGAVAIAAGQSQSIPITFAGSGLNAGAYQGSIIATSSATGAKVSVPYWLDVSSNTAVGFYSLCQAAQFCLTDWVRGATYLGAFDFRLTDAAGAPITGVTPTVTVLSGGGSVVAVNSADAPNANVLLGDPTGTYAGTYSFQDIPGLWTVDVKLGSATGTNVFQVSSGNVSQTFTVYGCSAIYIEIYGFCP